MLVRCRGYDELPIDDAFEIRVGRERFALGRYDLLKTIANLSEFSAHSDEAMATEEQAKSVRLALSFLADIAVAGYGTTAGGFVDKASVHYVTERNQALD